MSEEISELVAKEAQIEERWKENLATEIKSSVQMAVTKTEARAAAVAKEEALLFEVALETAKENVAQEVHDKVSKMVEHQLTKELTEAAEIEKAAAVAKAVAEVEAVHVENLSSHSAAADKAKADAVAEAVAKASIHYESSMSDVLKNATRNMKGPCLKKALKQRPKSQHRFDSTPNNKTQIRIIVGTVGTAAERCSNFRTRKISKRAADSRQTYVGSGGCRSCHDGNRQGHCRILKEGTSCSKRRDRSRERAWAARD